VRIGNAEKILIFIKHFNSKSYLLELNGFLPRPGTSDCFSLFLLYAKSPCSKGFPYERALTVRRADSYSVRKWRKVGESGFFAII